MTTHRTMDNRDSPRIGYLHRFTGAAACCIFASVATAQVERELSYPLASGAFDDLLGFSVDGGSDIDGDGVADILVGAPTGQGQFTFGAEAGQVLAFSGATGRRLFTIRGRTTGGRFGNSVAFIGDVDGDDLPEIAVGAPRQDNGGNNTGTVYVYDSPSYDILRRAHNGSADGEEFGQVVAGVGDVDGDGFVDYAAGSWRADLNGADSGVVRVFSGLDGSTLLTLTGDAAGAWFGFAISGVGDLNGDDRPDFIVGANRDTTGGTNAGLARVYSGTDGSILQTFAGVSGERVGSAVADAGDVNDDGVTDLAVLAPRVNGTGFLRVYSGSDWSLLIESDLPGVNLTDASIDGAGDLNGDGHDDLILGAPRDEPTAPRSGSVHLICGRTGGVIRSFNGLAEDDELGRSVSGGGDVNGDGLPDPVIGAPQRGQGDQFGAVCVVRSIAPPKQPDCVADLDVSGTLDIDDVLTFLAAFDAGCP